MKKLTILLAGLAIIGSSAQAKTDVKPTNTADSMGYYVGYTQGTIMGQNINNSPDITDAERDLYRSEFLRGVTQALLADTANTGYMDGLKMGAAMRDELIKLRDQGLPCNMELFNTTFATQVNNPDTTAINTYMRAVQALIQPVMERQQLAQQQQQQQAQQQFMDIAQANIAAGKAFMDSIKAVPGVKVTDSGLAYKVIKKGEGPTIGPRQQALIYYKGSLVDGSQFDATEPGQPVRLGPESVIKGFAEALMMLNKGAHYVFYIPQELAYGMQGPPVIGPAQTLVFDIEVVELLPE